MGEDPKVIKVDEDQGHEQEELGPLRRVAQEDLEVLDEDHAAAGLRGDQARQLLDEPKAREAGPARLLGLAPAREIEQSVEHPAAEHRGEGGCPERTEVEPV